MIPTYKELMKCKCLTEHLQYRTLFCALVLPAYMSSPRQTTGKLKTRTSATIPKMDIESFIPFGMFFFLLLT